MTRAMKLMCYCGKDVRHEPPFDDFHVERFKCGPKCVATPKPEELRPGVSPVLLRPAIELTAGK